MTTMVAAGLDHRDADGALDRWMRANGVYLGPRGYQKEWNTHFRQHIVYAYAETEGSIGV